jgi:hypothetical protein
MVFHFLRVVFIEPTPFPQFSWATITMVVFRTYRNDFIVRYRRFDFRPVLLTFWKSLFSKFDRGYSH